MENKDYEAKKRECWEEYCQAPGTVFRGPSAYGIFSAAFDRAYVLGKEKEDATTQQDYKSSELECWCDFCNTEIARKNSFDRALVKAANNFAFFRGYRFGKQEKDAEDTVIQGWVAKDNDSQGLYLYSSMPTRGINMWNGYGSLLILLDANLYPDLTWESDPLEVEIILKRKKK